MLDTNPLRITIIYRGGARETFTVSRWETQERGNDLTALSSVKSKPRRVYTRLDEVVSITAARRFPWGLFA